MKPAEIIAIGDSITWGSPLGQSFTHLIKQQYEIEILNYGLNGDTLEGMKKRLPGYLDHGIKKCIITGGTNDVFQGFDASDMMRNLLEMVALGSDKGLTVMVGLPIPILVKELENKLARFRVELSSQGLNLLQFDSLFYKNGIVDKSLYIDEAHINQQGYQIITDYLGPILSNNL